MLPRRSSHRLDRGHVAREEGLACERKRGLGRAVEVAHHFKYHLRGQDCEGPNVGSDIMAGGACPSFSAEVCELMK